MDDLAGLTIAGRYDVLELLGVGGMGEVYRARDRELDEFVALKVIRNDRAWPGMVEQFRHEVKLARRVTHINIARTFELGISDGVMFCTMELVQGESLRVRIDRGRVPVAEAATIVRALCDGLDVAHAAGVIHRDIKPENVLLTAGGRVVLADFGVAALRATDTGGALAGTLEYMAPEQARGESPTPACDVYSLGIVLFEMVTGMHAFSGSMVDMIVAKQTIEQLDLSTVPPELTEVVVRATARDPRERFVSAGALATALGRWMAPLPAAAPARRDTKDVTTIVVLAPRGTQEFLHIANGVHQELLRVLAQQPRVRVLPRSTAENESDAIVISLHTTESLVAAIDRTGSSRSLTFAPEVGSVTTIAGAIAGAVATPHEHRSNESFELLLRARTLARQGFSSSREALALLRRAHELDRDDPGIAAELAAFLIRYHFVGIEFEDALALAPVLLHRARAAAPHSAATHVASAHLALHTGDPIYAATEFRAAISRAPYLAEPHEGLGRMLLEAGFLKDAITRIDDALAIAPELSAVRWEVARAHALEQNWGIHDTVVAELSAVQDRPIPRLRTAIWRRDLPRILSIKDDMLRGPVRFEHDLFERVFACILEGAWPAHKSNIMARTRGVYQSKRRNALISQLAAETAGFVGDVDACLEALRDAVSYDLFDLHWFDRAPTLAAVRATVEGKRLHDIVRRSAHAIHDALFCDRDETMIG